MVHIGKIIEADLRNKNKSVTWLAQQLFCDRTNIYSIFKRASIDSAMLARISAIMDRDFFIEYASFVEEERVHARMVAIKVEEEKRERRAKRKAKQE